MLEKDIADLVQDADSIQRVFLAIKDNLSPDIIKVLSPLSIIEDQAPKVKMLRGICLIVKLYWPRRIPTDKRLKTWHN